MSREKLKGMVVKMDKHKKPIPIYFGTRQEVINYLHYGDPVLISQLKMMSFVELGLLALFVLIGFITFRNIKMAEQRTIWVGMAKETAHQLGTPLSSLLGWLELLKIKCESASSAPESSGAKQGTSEAGKTDEATPELHQMLEGMERDVKRLEKIATRAEID